MLALYCRQVNAEPGHSIHATTGRVFGGPIDHISSGGGYVATQLVRCSVPCVPYGRARKEHAFLDVPRADCQLTYGMPKKECISTVSI